MNDTQNIDYYKEYSSNYLIYIIVGMVLFISIFLFVCKIFDTLFCGVTDYNTHMETNEQREVTVFTLKRKDNHENRNVWEKAKNSTQNKDNYYYSFDEGDKNMKEENQLFSLE